MIVSYEGKRGGILLREVKNEQEAFAEMRRYLEVNNIPSNYTEIRWEEVNESRGILTRYKHVAMRCAKSSSDGVDFGIYYEGHPAHLELGSEEEWGIRRDQPPPYNYSYHYKYSENKFVCWYDEIAEYLKDLAERKAGGE